MPTGLGLLRVEEAWCVSPSAGGVWVHTFLPPSRIVNAPILGLPASSEPPRGSGLPAMRLALILFPGVLAHVECVVSFKEECFFVSPWVQRCLSLIRQRLPH